MRPDHQGPMSTSGVDLSEADVRGLACTQAPQARAVTCFSEEAKWSPTTTYMALEWRDLNSAQRWHLTILFPPAYTWQNQWLRLVAACASLYLKPLNPYASFTVSLPSQNTFHALLLLKRSIFFSKPFNSSKHDCDKVCPLSHNRPCFMIPMLITWIKCSGTIYVICTL